MAGLSFTSSGATPFLNSKPTASPFLSSPSVPTGSMSVPTPQGVRATYAGTNPAANALNAAQSSPAPTTPVKRVTTNNVDGSSTSTEYHAPAQSSSPTGATQPTTSGMLSSPFQVDPKTIGTPLNQQSVGQQNSGTTTPTFPGIIGSLANTAQNGSQNATTATTGLLGAPNQNEAIGQHAADIAANYGKQIADVGQKGAQFEGGQLTTGTSPVAEGNAAITAQTTAAQQAALAAGEQGALQGTAQELTAQNQGQSGLTNAGSIANTQQQNTQSGLQQAGQLSQPTSNFPFKFDPLTGSFANAATGASVGALTYNPTTDAATLAKEVINNQIPYAEAVTAMGYAPNNVGTGALQQAIVQAGGNIAALEGQATGSAAAAAAPGQASAANIGTAGTAQTSAYNTVYSKATADAATYSQQQSAINAIGNQALELMTNTPGINPQSSQFLNTKLNQLGTQLSSPQYAAFNTAVQSLQARIGAALQAGEIPTAATDNAKAIASGSLTVGALASTLKQVDAEMSSFVGTQQDLANYAKSQMQAGGSTTGASSSNYTEGSTISAGGYNFAYKNGKWVAT